MLGEISLTSTDGDMQSEQKRTKVNTSKYSTRKLNRLQRYVTAGKVHILLQYAPKTAPNCLVTSQGRSCVRPFTELPAKGHTVNQEIETISSVYSTVYVSAFVIMPNHVYMVGRAPL